jgi:outer membrane scaffolding protein for murein synthesis (MipA/OmpV family)
MPLVRAHFWRSVCVTTCALIGAGAASAQTTPDLFGDRWQVGGFVYMSPSYEGGKSYEVVGFPFAAPAGFGEDGAVQVKALDDIRFRLIRTGAFEFGPLAGYRFGRDESDAPRLVGMGDIDGGFVVGAFATYRTGPFAASISYHHQAAGDDTGGLIRFGLEHTQRLAPALKITTGVGTNYASDDYMTQFFGVSVAQAGLLPVYNASAGFKDVYAGVTASLDLNDRWTLMLIGRYSRLIGDAADSPVIETENQFYGGLGLSYKFDLR